MVKLGHCWPVPQGACGAGGAPAPGSGATTPLPEAGVRKHPAPEGALRQDRPRYRGPRSSGVRKHPAPEGALRRGFELISGDIVFVRKHPAPEGALRPFLLAVWRPLFVSQKAPSTRRCIKTHLIFVRGGNVTSGQKAPSTRRCIKTASGGSLRHPRFWSESTQHQKVH